MTAAKPEKATCPYCARLIALTKYGRLRKHKTRRGGSICARSGWFPQ